MENIKRILASIYGTTVVMGGTILCMNMLTLIPGALLLFHGLSKMTYGITGNTVKDSCFIVFKNKKIKFKDSKEVVDSIVQSPLSLKENIMGMRQKDKQKFFMLQCLNTFQQLPKQKGEENITYGCRTQAYTAFLLSKMQNEGYIQNLRKEKSDVKKSLFLEKLLLGVKQSKKPTQTYNMTFELTDKKFDAQATEELLAKVKIDPQSYRTKKDKRGNLILIPTSVKEPMKEITDVDVVKEENHVNIYKSLTKKLKLYREKFKTSLMQKDDFKKESSKKESMLKYLKDLKANLTNYQVETQLEQDRKVR